MTVESLLRKAGHAAKLERPVIRSSLSQGGVIFFTVDVTDTLWKTASNCKANIHLNREVFLVGGGFDLNYSLNSYTWAFDLSVFSPLVDSFKNIFFFCQCQLDSFGKNILFSTFFSSKFWIQTSNSSCWNKTLICAFLNNENPFSV